jgi:hypothetical protein
MTATLSITAIDFTALGLVPAQGRWFEFRRVLPEIGEGVESTEPWKVRIDAEGHATTQLPDGSETNGLWIRSNVDGWLRISVGAYPETVTLAELVLEHQVDAGTLEPLVPLPPSTQEVLAQAAAAAESAGEGAAGSASSATAAASSATAASSSATASAGSATAAAGSASSAADSASSADGSASSAATSASSASAAAAAGASSADEAADSAADAAASAEIAGATNRATAYAAASMRM